MRAFWHQPIYAKPIRLDFPCWTNSDYSEEFSFQDGPSYLDLTNHTFAMGVKVTPESTATLKTFSMAAGSGQEGFYLVDAIRGALQIFIPWETIKNLFNQVYPSIETGDQPHLACDIIVTLPNGDREIWASGYIILNKGTTYE